MRALAEDKAIFPQNSCYARRRFYFVKMERYGGGLRFLIVIITIYTFFLTGDDQVSFPTLEILFTLRSSIVSN